MHPVCIDARLSCADHICSMSALISVTLNNYRKMSEMRQNISATFISHYFNFDYTNLF